MKITERWRSSLCIALKAVPDKSAEYRDLGHSHERYRWDRMNETGWFPIALYDAGYNDDHIDTALRRILGTEYAEGVDDAIEEYFAGLIEADEAERSSPRERAPASSSTASAQP